METPMDLEDLTPAGGSFRFALRPASSAEPMATFTRTRAMHPAEIWSPKGGKLAGPQRPLTQPAQFYQHAESERPADRQHNTALPPEEIARAVRSALRPGAVG